MNIAIIGAGELGSRHLQALRSVDTLMQIWVIDASEASLARARERYEGIGGTLHPIQYHTQLQSLTAPLDLAIVATNANVRYAVVAALLEQVAVKYLILEKILFDMLWQYEEAAQRLQQAGVQAWVNCSMRSMPFYREIKPWFEAGPIHYTVTGSNFGLITNSIHYLDHVAFLTGCADYNIKSDYLSTELIASKRAGFKEVNGTLVAQYADGSTCLLRSFEAGHAPIAVEITSAHTRVISRESEGKAWVSYAAGQWTWEEVAARIPYQSELTGHLVKELLTSGTCPLVDFETSVQIHLPLMKMLADVAGVEARERIPFT